MRALWALLAVLCGCVVTVDEVWDDLFFEGEEENPVWVQVEHTTLPISFAVPADKTEPIGIRHWSFGLVEHRGASTAQLPFWGNGLVDRTFGAHAVEFGFLWLTPEFKRVDKHWLAELAAGIEEPGVVGGLFDAAFMTPAERELGLAFQYLEVEGHPAQRVGRARVLEGSEGVRPVQTVLVVPFGERGALLGLFYAAPQAGPEEREAVFERVVGSLTIDGDGL